MLALHREVPRQTRAEIRARAGVIVCLAAVLVVPFAIGVAIRQQLMAPRTIHLVERPAPVARVDPWASRFVLVYGAGHVAVLPVGVGDGP